MEDFMNNGILEEIFDLINNYEKNNL